MALFGACRAPAVPPQARSETTPAILHSAVAATAPSAPVPPTAADTPTSFEIYTSKEADDLEGWRLVLARRGTWVRLELKSNGTSGAPVELEGSITSDAKPTKLEAHARTSKATPLNFSGVIEPSGKLHGVLSTSSARELIELRPLPLPNGSEETWKNDFGGTLDNTHRFRLGWVQKGDRTLATLSRLGEKPTTFEGSLERQSGRFELQEPKQPEHRLRGILLGGPGDVDGIGELFHDGLAQPFSLDRFYPTYPPVVELPNGARVVPVERFQRGFPDCPAADDVFPRVEGVAAALPLNRALEKTISPLTECGNDNLSFLGSLWSGSTYTVTASSARWVGFAFDWNSYMGGAHGSFGLSCAVADTQSGKVVHLNEEIAPASFPKLSALVRQAILRGEPGKSLVDLGFYADDAHVDATREMCVVKDHGALFLEVVYQNDMDEAGLFHFVKLRPRLAAAVVRRFFPPGSVGAAVFQ